MAIKRPRGKSGTLVTLEHHSRVLKNNPWGDPSTRNLSVWLPAQYDQHTDAGEGVSSGTASGNGRRFPVLFDLAGYTSSGLAHTGWKNFSENLPERVARLIHDQQMAPTIIVFADCFTALGGTQYINSSALGAYADYLVKELVPFVDREFRTLASREHRGCFGRSSGGYGAMIHGMKYPHIWGAIANHSGDSYFDVVYRHDWPNTLNELAKYRPRTLKAGPVDVLQLEADAQAGLDDGRIRRFLDKLFKKVKLNGAEVHALMNLCMAASYDPDPKAPNGFRVPFNLETGELLQARWKRWQAHDPINLVSKYKKNLQTLRGIYLDCGWRDQYQIHYGMRILSKRLQQARVPHRYEEFDDTHSDIDYRLDVSLPFLSKALAS